ncbi:MAG: D-alanine--D-alanine ligase [Deferribacteres bacterium]|nr:D-alanine--D-alanine ligase [candidate division KSB1 bacterium]MCB9504178.1 D-alanine--D-alanine ligase [Deferribacteres bacterium]
MSQKINVAILFGGKSAEHEVSLQSAKNVIEAIDKNKFDVTLIGIDKNGRWYLNDASHFLLHGDDPKQIRMQHENKEVALVAGRTNKQLVELSLGSADKAIDVVFPILHGPLGEDGTVQGLLKLANIPFVGAGVLGSAVGMDKDVMKRLLRDAGLPIGKFVTILATKRNAHTFAELTAYLGAPLFIKPANMGSSVGVHRVENDDQFQTALDDAFKYDTKVIIEEFIEGREIECAVLGNDEPKASVPGEIIPHHQFYSYEAKYIDADGAGLQIPAELPGELVAKIQEYAVATFQTLICEGMARVDFFLQKDGKIVINEINTIPGFTRISMYPKLWAASGIPYSQLIEKLIFLALDRFDREKQLQTDVGI